ncbi:MAG TPA: GNAT family N-acetyltransferase [Acidimicrobiales bacterium]
MACDEELPVIRPRREGDMAACASIARELRDVDGYPAFLPDDDFGAFLAPENALGAWVALLAGDVVGHVAIRSSSAPSATELITDKLGLDASRVAFVSRLMVVPRARRQGIARSLLETAAQDIRGRGLVAVLDVLVRDAAAIALYEAAGWTRLGETRFTSRRTGQVFDEVVFLAPGG